MSLASCDAVRLWQPKRLPCPSRDLGEPFTMSAENSRSGANQPRRTAEQVIDWFSRHDLQTKSPSAKAERQRVRRLFCAYVNSEGRRIGDSLTDDCNGADLLEFLNANLAGRSQWTRRRW